MSLERKKNFSRSVKICTLPPSELHVTTLNSIHFGSFVVMLVSLILVTCVIVVIVTFTAYKLYFHRKSLQNIKCISAMFIFGSGGHTAEMCQLIKSLNPTQSYGRTHFVVAANDQLSLQKINSMQLDGNTSIHLISRSRAVGQSWISTLFTFTVATIQSIVLILTTQPHLVIANGPGTCVPICLAARIIPGKRVIIFVESICRVKTFSLSGKILYPIVDQVVVQWPDLVNLYPRAKYLGSGLI